MVERERPARLDLELRAVQGHAEELLKELRTASARLEQSSTARDADKAMCNTCLAGLEAIVIALAIITTRTRLEAFDD